MRVAALDLGSNTSLLLICDVEGGQITQVHADELEVTRLGQEVDKTKRLHKEALARAEACFARYQKIIEKFECDKIVAVATSAARDAENSKDFFDLGAKYGIPISIIPGALEAKLTFLGATSNLKDVSGLSVIDVGGGSTEVITESSPGVWSGKSLDIGSVRLTEKFALEHPVVEESLNELCNYIDEVISKNSNVLPTGTLRTIAVAGTPTTLSCVQQGKVFSEAQVDGHWLSNAEMLKLSEFFAKSTLDDVKSTAGMDPKRADVIVAGASILRKCSEFLGPDGVEVSTRGVRYGVALCWEEVLENS